MSAASNAFSSFVSSPGSIFFSPEMRSSTLAVICERVFETDCFSRSSSEPPSLRSLFLSSLPKIESIRFVAAHRRESHILAEQKRVTRRGERWIVGQFQLCPKQQT